MIFPVFSKFNAELVKSVKVAVQGLISYMSFFKHSRASNSKVNSSESLCLS